MQVSTKIVSSLEKCFLSNKASDFSEVKTLSALKGERISFQLLIEYQNQTTEKYKDVLCAKVKLRGRLKRYATVRAVQQVAVAFPCYPTSVDNDYIKTTPGLYPDALTPLTCGNLVSIPSGSLISLWITVDIPDNLCGGLPLTVSLTDQYDSSVTLSKSTINIKVIDAALPSQELIFTQWFYGDCLANYYNCSVFSPKWWKIAKSFIKTAVKNGINMILTPVFTPPLDTEIGKERKTVQLVGVEVAGENEYKFCYDNLDKWLDFCLSAGIKYFEISHLFTQWGAKNAPKIMATVNGKSKRIFGWDTDATSPRYVAFLRAFLTDFLAHMKERNQDKLCYFHISDEPHPDHLEQYKAVKAGIIDLLNDYVIMDALSNYEFYRQGIVNHPVPATNRITPFLENKVQGLWTYYCCGQNVGVSNRFIAMPSARTRCIGAQMFKYDIKGFLHWGYNFYNTGRSLGAIDPNRDTCGEYFTPSGDANSVYPNFDGTALESIRLVVFYDAIQDMRAFSLCASLIGKQATVQAIESVYGQVEFDKCQCDSDTLMRVREKINSLIESAL